MYSFQLSAISFQLRLYRELSCSAPFVEEASCQLPVISCQQYLPDHHDP